VKKLVETDYLVQERSKHDKRAIRLKLTDKAKTLSKVLESAFDRHVKAIPNFQIQETELTSLNEALKKIERFWTVALTQGV
jgi:DNA-binding MarR family transcriptional regulator